MMNTPIRFHVLGLPQLDTNPEWYLCGFAPKLVNFCRILKSLGHHVTLYTGEHSTALADETVTVVTDAERTAWLGGTDKQLSVFASFEESKAPLWALANDRMIAEIGKRKVPGDMICHIGGTSQQRVTRAHSDLVACEFGVGYLGICEKNIVFESHSWRQFCCGRWPVLMSDGRFFDAVIPNYLDPEDFPYRGGGLPPLDEDYVLYCGRLTPRKGMEIIRETAKMLPTVKFKMIGPGFIDTTMPPNVQVIGVVSNEERARLMGNARCLMAPTLYNEPFGNIVIEAGMCATPVITTDFGAFPETVIHGLTGYRCNTLGEFVRAVQDCETEINLGDCHYEAMKRYSIDAVTPQYGMYFERLRLMYGKGWYG